MPKSVETRYEGTVTEPTVRTARTIPNNKPDITLSDNEKRTCMLKDAANPGDRNVIKKEDEMILKYKDLTTEIQHVWNVKAKVIPVIIVATGTVSKSLRQYLSNIPGKREIKEIKRIANWARHTYHEQCYC